VCRNNGICENTNGSYFCNCPEEYTGPDCETTIGGVDDEGNNAIAIAVPVTIFIILIITGSAIVVVVVIVNWRRYSKRHGSSQIIQMLCYYISVLGILPYNCSIVVISLKYCSTFHH